MHPACVPPQTQRAQMFSFLSCEGARSPKLIKAQHGRVVNSTTVKETKREREKERETETETEQRQRQRRRKGKRKRKRKERERESDGRASEFVARRMLSVVPAGSVNIQIKVRGDNTVCRETC